jgi:hypothetical protein
MFEILLIFFFEIVLIFIYHHRAKLAVCLKVSIPSLIFCSSKINVFIILFKLTLTFVVAILGAGTYWYVSASLTPPPVPYLLNVPKGCPN